MTTSYQRHPERGSSSEVQPQTPEEIKKTIGKQACNFTFIQDLDTLFNFRDDKTYQHIIDTAYFSLMAEISQQPVLKSQTEAASSYDDLDEAAKNLIKTPAFRIGFTNMQSFLKNLAEAIDHPLFQNNNINIGGMVWEKPKYEAGFNKDPRCLGLAEDAAEAFMKRLPGTQEGASTAAGNLFAFFIFKYSVVDFIEPYLDRLVKSK